MSQRLAMDKNDHSHLSVAVGRVLVGILTFAFFISFAVLLYSKWKNFDPYMLDFFKIAIIYEKLIQCVPYEYSMHYYVHFFMGVYPIFLPVYLVFRSIWVVFALHLIGFSLPIPVLYKISREVLPGVLLPLAMVFAYVLNPSMNMMAIGFVRLEALWGLLFFLIAFSVLKSRYKTAIFLSALACFIRLDTAPTIFLLGFMYWLQNKKKLGLKIMMRSILVTIVVLFAMAMFYLISGIGPAPEGVHVAALEQESENMIYNLIQGMVTALVRPQSYSHFVICLQFLLLPLLAPIHLLPALFSCFYIVQSHEGFLAIPLVDSLLTPENTLVPYLHIHDSFLLPMLFVAMVYGIRNLVRFFEKRMSGEKTKSRFRAGLATVLITCFCGMHWNFATPELGPIPLTPYFNVDYYRTTPHSRFCWKVLSDVPKDKPGVMQYSFKDRAYDFPLSTCMYPSTQIHDDTRYTLFDLYAFSPNMPKGELLGKIEEIVASGEFAVELFEDGVIYLTRGAPNQKNQKVQKYIADNRQWLSQNLASPYMYGNVPRDTALQNVFSETMLPDAGDR